CYSWKDKLTYLSGLKFYDWLSVRLSLGASRSLSKRETLERLPFITQDRLKGGVMYYDGQFDDARLALNLAQTAVEQGATVLNYMRVTDLVKSGGRITGVKV